MGKVKRGTQRGKSMFFHLPKKGCDSRPGGPGERGGGGGGCAQGGEQGAAKQGTHFRKAPRKVTWGHQWLEGHALE